MGPKHRLHDVFAAASVRLFTAVFAAYFTSVSVGAAAELRILTSMSQAFFEPFIAAFEDRNPEISVIVLNKNTNASIAEIVRGNPRAFDIFWASSAEAFEVLNARDAFRRDNRGGQESASGANAAAAFYPFAYSSIGWAQRGDSAIMPPRQWEDLLQDRYAGQIAMARPSRSGTAHMFVERFLQVRGWEEGWSYLLALTANISTLTSRSFGVVDGVEKQRFELGITIDFLAQSRRDQGVSFSYGKPVMVIPAQIGLLKGGVSEQEAMAFIRFVLSEEGQTLLLMPSVWRVPVDDTIRQSARNIPPEITYALKLNWLQYDALLARDRYWAVNALFDQFITSRLPKRRLAWAKYREILARGDSRQSQDLARVKALLTRMPVSEREAGDRILNDSLTRLTALTGPTGFQQRSLTRWAIQAEELLIRAGNVLEVLDKKGPNTR
ncbi:ABC transporter substrate-binding protein [Candidatus Halocynthiibacter alkanivorans]|uniref:ABC transporter substrate-binding protein n=1 Tax=Candidatus Halocynthiibacter alkanivorans TaxID=2267619 RepID=UPI00135950AE|nr:ABC transporter substrate-binding protein [Candidatus Halocynthiibacter alkanivorans]